MMVMISNVLYSFVIIANQKANGNRLIPFTRL
jgi:hypothetical protein